MEKELTMKKTLSVDKPTAGVEVLTVVKSIIQKQHNHDPKMGTGSCTLCDCPSFMPSTGGQTCINSNSEGGTCNHYESEHN
ncbi:MAG: hypothetical protein JWQ25_1931 [Daejeonella sp.]|nr:hypothetical protein [Daejeonella sp.]